MEDNAVSLYRTARHKLIITKFLRVYIRNSEYLKSAGLTQKNKSISNWKDLYAQLNSKDTARLIAEKFSAIFSDAFARAIEPLKLLPEHQALACVVLPKIKTGDISVYWTATVRSDQYAEWEELLRPLVTDFNQNAGQMSPMSYGHNRYRNTLNIAYAKAFHLFPKINQIFNDPTGGLPSDEQLEAFLIQPRLETLRLAFQKVGELPGLVAAKAEARAAALEEANRAAASLEAAESVATFKESIRVSLEPSYSASAFIWHTIPQIFIRSPTGQEYTGNT